MDKEGEGKKERDGGREKGEKEREMEEERGRKRERWRRGEGEKEREVGRGERDVGAIFFPSFWLFFSLFSFSPRLPSSILISFVLIVSLFFSARHEYATSTNFPFSKDALPPKTFERCITSKDKSH